MPDLAFTVLAKIARQVAICGVCLAVSLIPMQAQARTTRTSAEPSIEARLLAEIKILASDEFEGREPGTQGEIKTLRYLGHEWFDMGLSSGTNDPGHEWFVPVTLVVRSPDASRVQFWRHGRPLAFDRKSILALTSGKRAMVSQAPLLFVGLAHDDNFTRTELAGRIAVLLDGDATDSRRQNALLAKGASAVLTVLDGKRSLADVTARRDRAGYALADEALGGDLEAFITRDAMVEVLRGAGLSLDALEKKASSRQVIPVPLGMSLTMEATTRETTIHTHNLIGKLPGRHPEAGAVLFLAHWDHFGECRPAPAPDRICNGAIDNASGVAALTEVARQLAKGPSLDRDVYFLATTGEELGLLGAHAFAENPPLPLGRIVAAFNIDSVAIAPHGTPFAIVGRGLTALDPQIEAVAKAEHVHLLANDDANEFVRRQDGWALLQHDIPAVMVTTAYGDLDRLRAFFSSTYHGPSDDFAHLGDLGGAVDDVKMLTALGRWFGDIAKVPSAAGKSAETPSAKAK